jgi:hypothetical protein
MCAADRQPEGAAALRESSAVEFAAVASGAEIRDAWNPPMSRTRSGFDCIAQVQFSFIFSGLLKIGHSPSQCSHDCESDVA